MSVRAEAGADQLENGLEIRQIVGESCQPVFPTYCGSSVPPKYSMWVYT